MPIEWRVDVPNVPPVPVRMTCQLLVREGGYYAGPDKAQMARTRDATHADLIAAGYVPSTASTSAVEWAELERRVAAAEKDRDALRAELASLQASLDPSADATDGAHPAWWRGHDDGAKGMTALVEKLRAELAEVKAERDEAVTLADFRAGLLSHAEGERDESRAPRQSVWVPRVGDPVRMLPTEFAQHLGHIAEISGHACRVTWQRPGSDVLDWHWFHRDKLEPRTEAPAPRRPDADSAGEAHQTTCGNCGALVTTYLDPPPPFDPRAGVANILAMQELVMPFLRKGSRSAEDIADLMAAARSALGKQPTAPQQAEQGGEGPSDASPLPWRKARDDAGNLTIEADNSTFVARVLTQKDAAFIVAIANAWHAANRPAPSHSPERGGADRG